MLNNLTNFFNLIRGNKIKTTPDGSDLIPLGTRDPRYDGFYQPTGITVDDFVASLPPAGVQSVTGLNTDNTDPLNPIVEISVDGVTITGDGTPGNPLVAAGGGAVNYANVIFVDSTNGNDGTGAINDFTKPMATIGGAVALASGLASSFNDRALIYIRKGLYFLSGTNTLYDYVDFYSEVGVVIQGGYARISDQSSPGPVNVNFMGYADIVNCDLYIIKASTLNLQVNSITNDNAILLSIPASGTANITLEATKLYSQGLGTNYGITIRNSSNVTVNIKEKYSCTYSLFDIRNHSGRVVVNAPKLALADGNPYGYGGNFKQVVIIRANLGGEMIINGDLVNEEILSYAGSNAGIISRVQDSWGTLRINGSIYSGNMFGVNAQGTSAASRTIVNGDIRTNHLCAYVGNNSSVVFRNGTLINWNNLVGVSEGYPVISMGGTGSVWVENCHLHSLGLGATYPNIAAFWKDTTTATLNVYNSVHSGADTPGFFIRNSAPAQPVNNVRILNCRATKPLDTNITDVLTPTGFTQDANVQSINFI
jgi:hypothetical protein